MAHPPEGKVIVEAELGSPIATVQLVRFELEAPINHVVREERDYRLDLSLTPRPLNTRGCYRDHWSANRFERIGKVFLLPPRQNLLTRTDGALRQQSILCGLRANAMYEALGDELPWNGRSLEASLDVRDEQVRGLLIRLAQEARYPGFAANLLVELIAGQLAIELFRYCTQASATFVTRGLAPWRLRVIDERLREVGELPTLTELAALCRISVRQLTRGFRASRGCSIGDYVANRRIDQAKGMLQADGSVKSIAYLLGFSSPSSFSFAFRRATGVTPREFRQRAPWL